MSISLKWCVNGMHIKRILLTSSLFLLIITAVSPLSAQDQQLAENEVSIPFQITPTGHQIVTLMHEGKPIRMILDTGAGANVFSNVATKKLKLTTQASNRKAAGIGTTAHEMLHVAPTTFVIEHKRLMLANFVSMDLSHIQKAGGKKPIDGLLGSPFFQAYRARLDFSTNTMVIKTTQDQRLSKPKKNP